MDYFQQVLTVIDRYKFLGEKLLPDGTYLVGKAPHIAPQAWLHNIFPVLKTNEIEMIEREIGYSMPNSYKHFLINHSNGLKLFVDTLSLDGIRKKIGRNIENAWQPYSIFTPNKIERIKNAKPFHFFIGGYNWDGSLLFIDNNTSKVHRCSSDSIKVLNTWNCFEEMIMSETNRLASIFNINGVQEDEDFPTIP